MRRLRLKAKAHDDSLDTAVRYWHLHHIHVLRQQYQASHGPIDIPEAMYFDGLAVMVQSPLLLAFLILQIASAVAFYCIRSGAGAWQTAGFWCLWLIAWPVCVFAPLLFMR